MPDVRIFTDGSCYPNPGPGAYFAAVTWGSDEAILEALETYDPEMDQAQKITVSEGGQPVVSVRLLGGIDEESTNNQMELMAVIVALEALKSGAKATVYSDSEYICNAINQNWVGGWERNGWHTRQGTPVANLKLWQRLLQAKSGKTILFRHLTGHAGNGTFESTMNNFCDEQANRLRKNGD